MYGRTEDRNRNRQHVTAKFWWPNALGTTPVQGAAPKP